MSFAGTMQPHQTRPLSSKDANMMHEFDILASVVSRYQQVAPKMDNKSPSPEHRISCHRCGNIRKRRILCSSVSCPHTFCGRCAEKMKEEHGSDIFEGGCPVCKELCCCSNKSVYCHRRNHCYRKCPATRSNSVRNAKASKSASTTHCTNTDSEEADNASLPGDDASLALIQDLNHSVGFPPSLGLGLATDTDTPLCPPCSRSDGGQYGIFELLVAVADMDKAAARDLQMTELLFQQQQQQLQLPPHGYEADNGGEEGADADAAQSPISSPGRYDEEDELLESPRKRMKATTAIRLAAAVATDYSDDEGERGSVVTVGAGAGAARKGVGVGSRRASQSPTTCAADSPLTVPISVPSPKPIPVEGKGSQSAVEVAAAPEGSAAAAVGTAMPCGSASSAAMNLLALVSSFSESISELGQKQLE